MYRSPIVETSLTGMGAAFRLSRLAAVFSREAKVRASEPFLEQATFTPTGAKHFLSGFVQRDAARSGVTAQRSRCLDRRPGIGQWMVIGAVHDPVTGDAYSPKRTFHRSQSSSQAGARSSRNSLTTPHFSSSSARFSVPMNTWPSDTSTRATMVRLRSAGSVTEA